MWQKGYLFAYVGTYGVVILYALFLNRYRKSKDLYIIGIAILCWLAVVNGILADGLVDKYDWYDKHKFLGNAIYAGLYEKYDYENTIINSTDMPYFLADHYAKYLHKKVRSANYNDLFETADDGTTRLKDIENEKFDYTSFKYKEYVLYSENINIYEETDEKTYAPYGKNLRIYIPKDVIYTNIIGISKSGKSEILDIKDKIKSSDKGDVYRFSFSNEVNLNKISLLKTNVLSSGNGTKENPYKISAADDLNTLSELVNSGIEFDGSYFIQTDDIDLSKFTSFIPIGTFNSSYSFKGVYNGLNHKIFNLNIDGFNGLQHPNVGLFGILSGTVCNLGIESGKITGACIGSIASHSGSNKAKIFNCYNKADIIGENRAGGIADNFTGGDIICCVNYADGISIGGIASYAARNIWGLL